MTEIPSPTESAQMPRYLCHKTVHALKCRAEAEVYPTNDSIRLIPFDKRYADISVSVEWARQKNVERTGYYVVYEDGYASWSPVEAFEKGYTLITASTPDCPVCEMPDGDHLDWCTPQARGSSRPEVVKEKYRSGRITELTTALSNVSRTLRECVALADSTLINSEPSGFRKRWPNQGDSPLPQMVAQQHERIMNGDLKPGPIVERYTYYVPPCGCQGFFHSSACSDQNPLDPLSSISNPDNRERVRAIIRRTQSREVIAATTPPFPRLSSESPWVVSLRRVLDIAKRGLESPSAETTLAFEEAEALLRDGVSLKS